jgi:hypothetical protein
LSSKTCNGIRRRAASGAVGLLAKPERPPLRHTYYQWLKAGNARLGFGAAALRSSAIRFRQGRIWFAFSRPAGSRVRLPGPRRWNYSHSHLSASYQMNNCKVGYVQAAKRRLTRTEPTFANDLKNEATDLPNNRRMGIRNEPTVWSGRRNGGAGGWGEGSRRPRVLGGSRPRKGEPKAGN